MDPLDNEIMERIPWETLETPKRDRTWLIYAVSGAIVLAAVAYSFVSSRPIAAPVIATTQSTLPAVISAPPASLAPPTTVMSPVVVTEADLFAVDAEALELSVLAHAQWTAVEWVTRESSQETLRALLPAEVPLPEVEDGVQVYVDFAAPTRLTRTGPANFEVAVLVRSLVANGDEKFVRQDPQIVTVAIELGSDGSPMVIRAPEVGLHLLATPSPIGVVVPPVDP